MGSIVLTNTRTNVTFLLEESLLGALGELSDDAGGPSVALGTLREGMYDDGVLDPSTVRGLANEIAAAMKAFEALGFMPDGSIPADEVFESREARARRTFRRQVFDPAALETAVEPFATFVHTCAASSDAIAWTGLG